MDNHTSNSLPEYEGREQNGGHDGKRDGALPPEALLAHLRETEPLLPAHHENRLHTHAVAPQKPRAAVGAGAAAGGGAALSGKSEQGKDNPGLLFISAAALTIVLSAVMSLSILPGQVEIKLGLPAPHDILSPS